MPVTRTATHTYLTATPDDHGNVHVTADGNTLTITPDEARTIANELVISAEIADTYRAEMNSLRTLLGGGA